MFKENSKMENSKELRLKKKEKKKLLSKLEVVGRRARSQRLRLLKKTLKMFSTSILISSICSDS